jgi:hypothetical protein
MDLDAFAADRRHLGLLRAVVSAGYHRAHRTSGLRLYRFLTLEPAGVNQDLLTRGVPYECRILEDTEIRDLSRDPENQMSGRFVDRILAKRDVCYGILDGGVLASIGWYSNAPTTVQKSVTIRFDPRYLYMYGGYTRPAYRGRNLHGIGLARACEALCARGYQGFVTVAERFNFASLVSAHRVGFRDCGLAAVIGLGGRMRIWQTRTPERYALRLEATPDSHEPA